MKLRIGLISMELKLHPLSLQNKKKSYLKRFYITLEHTRNLPFIKKTTINQNRRRGLIDSSRYGRISLIYNDRSNDFPFKYKIRLTSISLKVLNNIKKLNN